MLGRIDFNDAYSDKHPVKRWLSILMLAGVLLGLLGQEAAFARGMLAAKAGPVSATATQMSADCAEMMALAKQVPQPEAPCQGMTPDCIAKMGCAVPLALIPPLAFDLVLQFRAATPLQAPVAPLVGRDTGPEPEPPARLG
ncbi:MAG: hypothetical protein AB7G24_05485 [Novosphingobium sp.]